MTHVSCPVCQRVHPLYPKGDALTRHRAALLWAPAAAVQAWRAMLHRTTTTPGENR